MFSFRGIKAGDCVHFHFAGGPAHLPEPWKVLKVRYKWSSVNYKRNPSITIRAANGLVETFDWAAMYSPVKVSQ